MTEPQGLLSKHILLYQFIIRRRLTKYIYIYIYYIVVEHIVVQDVVQEGVFTVCSSVAQTARSRTFLHYLATVYILQNNTFTELLLSLCIACEGSFEVPLSLSDNLGFD